MLVEMRRGTVVESRHRGHVVEVGPAGTPLRGVGDPDTLVTLRSAQKPFTLVALIESGAADAFELQPPELALMAASHAGEDLHVRTLQAIFRRAGLSQSLLACGAAGMPLDELTRTRLIRDGERPGPIRHMCSGYHAASILLSRHADWPLEDYWRPEHPSQVATRSAVARVFGVPVRSLASVVDGCGLATYAFPLVEIARAYALLADPAGVATDPTRSALAPALRRVRDAMLAAPEMVGGTRDRLDTALMKACPGALVAKGGAEAVRGVALLPFPRSGNGTAGGVGVASAGGVAVKIEDGDGYDRAGRAVAIESLRQIGVLDDRTLRQLGRYHRAPQTDPRGQVTGEAATCFELAPLGELV